MAKGIELAGEHTKKRCNIYTPYIQQREKHKHDEKMKYLISTVETKGYSCLPHTKINSSELQI